MADGRIRLSNGTKGMATFLKTSSFSGDKHHCLYTGWSLLCILCVHCNKFTKGIFIMYTYIYIYMCVYRQNLID